MMGRVALTAALVLSAGCTPTGRSHAQCGQTSDSRSATAPTATPDERGLVLMTLQTRNHEVTVYGGGRDLRFTVMAHGSGAVLAERIDELEFARSFPGIHRHFRSAFADEGIDPTAGAWAGM
jgi:hypothetical protein